MDIAQLARFFKAVEKTDAATFAKECPTVKEGNFLWFLHEHNGGASISGALAWFFSALADSSSGGINETMLNEMKEFGDRYGQ